MTLGRVMVAVRYSTTPQQIVSPSIPCVNNRFRPFLRRAMLPRIFALCKI
jgi:hypothetical protein